MTGTHSGAEHRGGRVRAAVVGAALVAFALTSGDADAGLSGGRPAVSTSTASMNVARMYHTATLLRDGRVLVAGGVTVSGSPTASTETRSASVDVWVAGQAMALPRAFHTATLLLDGRVLIVGGCADWNPCTIAQSRAEIFDPATGAWSATLPMSFGRYFHTATLLTDGRVLVAGGCDSDPCDAATASAEIFDPSGGAWLNAGTMRTARLGHTATALGDGRVLVAGGCQSDPCVAPLGSAEVFDPSRGTWSAVPPMGDTRHLHTATKLADGRILVAGGLNADREVATAEVFSPASGTWQPAASMNVARECHDAAILADGRVLVGGGYGGGFLASIEIYDPVADTWTQSDDLLDARDCPRALRVPDGRVIIGGGIGITDSPIASVEVWSPDP